MYNVSFSFQKICNKDVVRRLNTTLAVRSWTLNSREYTPCLAKEQFVSGFLPLQKNITNYNIASGQIYAAMCRNSSRRLPVMPAFYIEVY